MFSRHFHSFPGLNNVPAIGNIPIFEFSLIVLFVIGAIYWFGFKRRTIIANGEIGFDPAANYGTSQQD